MEEHVDISSHSNTDATQRVDLASLLLEMQDLESETFEIRDYTELNGMNTAVSATSTTISTSTCATCATCSAPS